METMTANFQPLTPLRFLERSAAVFPDKPAIVCGDRRLTYQDRWGERPKAFVVLAPGQAAGERELIEHVRSRIAHFKAPDTIEFLRELPRNSTGKVQKFELRQPGLAKRRVPVG